MGGEGSGRRPSEATIVARATAPPTQVHFGSNIQIPNFAGVSAHQKTRSAFVPVDRRFMINLHDDFIGSNAATTLGETSWSRGTVVANAANWSHGDGEGDHPGVITFNTGIAASYHTVNKNSSCIEISGGEEFRFMGRWNALSSAGEWSFAFGLSDTTNSYSPTDAMMFYYDTATSNNMQFIVYNGGLPPADADYSNPIPILTYGDWHEFVIKVADDNTRISFYIDDVLTAYYNNAHPSGDGREMGIYFVGRNVSQLSDIAAFEIDYVTFTKYMPNGRSRGIAIGA